MGTDDDVGAALGVYLSIVDDVAPGLVEGLYVVGSVALDDWAAGRSDIDIVAVTAEPATDDDVGLLRTAHALLADAQPTPHIDGPYVAWGDLPIAPATGLHRPYVLGNELRHDGDCFEINPITWFTLATYGRTVRGAAPAKLQIWTSVEERVRFCVDNLATYWSQVADGVEAACADPTAAFDAESFVWCALGALRLHYTAFTGDVTSKRGAAEYALDLVADELRATLALALDLRRGPADTPVAAPTMAGAAAVIRWVMDEVERASPQ